MAFGSSNHTKKAPITTKSNTLKQHLKRWIGWGSKKTQQQKLPPTSFNESLPLSSCVDEGIYDDATSSCPLIPKTNSTSVISSTMSTFEPCTTIYSSDTSILDESVESPSGQSDTSSLSGTIVTAPLPPSLYYTISESLDNKPLSRSPTWNQSIDQAQDGEPSLANALLDMDRNVDTKLNLLNTEDSKYLVYEWPSDDDDENDNDDDNDGQSSINLASWMNQATGVLGRSVSSSTLSSMARSTTHYFDCILQLDQIETLKPVDQDLSSGSNSSFYSTSTSFTVAHDDSASILDTDALLLVTHGVEFLKRRENTNWDDTDPSCTIKPSYSGVTLVPLKGQDMLSLDKNTTMAQEDEQELHRLVNTHILF